MSCLSKLPSRKAERERKRRRFRAYRKRVHRWTLAADLYQCQHCLARRAAQTHHCYRKGANIDGWREHPNAILSLCFECHDAHEARGTISKEELIRDLELARRSRPPIPDWVIDSWRKKDV